MRIIFAGTPEFSVPPLEALIQQHEVIAVFTQPDRRSGRGKKLLPPPVKQIAQLHDIEVYQPTTLAGQHDLIKNMQPDVMVVVAYGMILPAKILSLPKLGCINIHASLLPRWRGAAPIQRAIQAGDLKTGVSIMQMEEGLDTGPVYQTLQTEIGPNDTSVDLHQRLARLGEIGIIDTLRSLESTPSTTPLPQDHSRTCYAQKIKKDEALIDWRETAEALHNKIRAFIPWPICETNYLENRVRIWRSEVADTVRVNAAPGTVIATEPYLQIACGERALSLLSLQRSGGKPISSQEFCNGYNVNVGDHFGPSSGSA